MEPKCKGRMYKTTLCDAGPLGRQTDVRWTTEAWTACGFLFFNPNSLHHTGFVVQAEQRRIVTTPATEGTGRRSRVINRGWAAPRTLRSSDSGGSS